MRCSTRTLAGEVMALNSICYLHARCDDLYELHELEREGSGGGGDTPALSMRCCHGL